jgi:hypothetical protein
MERAASNYRDGRAAGFETLATYVTPALAYLIEGREIRSEDRRSGRARLGRATRHHRPSPRGRSLADLAPARRSDYDSARRGVA